MKVSFPKVTVSLKWDSTDDLDLHVNGENLHIYFGAKKGGGGWLDVDMNPAHDTKEPVENVFWETCPRGVYQIRVHNYSYGGNASVGTNRKIPFELALRTKIPVEIEGEKVVGTLVKRGEIIGTGDKSFQTVITFEVTQNHDVEKTLRDRVEQIEEALEGGLTMAVVDSSMISGWKPEERGKWKLFRKNLERILSKCKASGTAFHLQATNINEIAEKFEEVGALMEDNLTEHL